jgi:hypothetical protein
MPAGALSNGVGSRRALAAGMPRENIDVAAVDWNVTYARVWHRFDSSV